MQFIILILIIITLTNTHAFAAEIISIVTDEDFNQFQITHEYSFVMFYAPWCYHCIKALPELNQAAEQLIDFSPPVRFATVDCTNKGKETCNNQDLNGLPTMKLFKRTKLIQKYDGIHEAHYIATYIWTELGPASVELSCVQELAQFMQGRNRVHIIGFFENESPLKISYLNHPKTLWKHAKFAHIDSKNIPEAECKNCVILFRPIHLNNKFENNMVMYKGNGSDLGHFIIKNYHGLAGHRRPDNKIDFPFPLIVAYYNIDYQFNVKRTNYWRNRFMSVAKSYADKLNFAISSNNEFMNELHEITMVNVSSDRPIIIGRDDDDIDKFVMEKEFTVDNFEEFVRNMIDNKLEVYVKSQAIPLNNTGPVFVAVATNFEQLVMKNGKDTFLEFYAPWCEQCTKVAPIYDDLGMKLANEDVLIVKMDATANAVPVKFKMRGYPSFYWLAKDSKQDPIEYVGGRNLEDFIEYIARYANKELIGYDREGYPKAKKS